MHCISFVARWALCACLLTITNPFEAQTVASAQAQKKKSSKSGKARKAKGVRRCVDFTQSLASDEESVDLQLTNSCNFEISCSVEWKLECSTSVGTSLTDQSKKATSLDHLESWDLNASASACETDWEIKNVSWQCIASEG